MKTFLIQLFENPTEYLSNLIEKRKFSAAFFCYALGALSVYFSLKLCSQKGTNFGSFIFVFLIWLLFNILANFVLAANTNMFLDFEKNTKQNKAAGIFILLGISQLLLTLLIPWSLTARAFGQIAYLTPLIFFIIFILQITFFLNLLKKIYGVSRRAALINLLLASVLPFILAGLFVVFSIGFLTILFA